MALLRAEHVDGEEAGLAQVAQRGAVALQRDGDEARVEANLHHPVGHHAVDVVGAARADDVESVGHRLQRFDDRVKLDLAGHGCTTSP